MLVRRAVIVWGGLAVLILFAALPVRADDRADALTEEVVKATNATKTLTADLIYRYDDGDQKETLKGKLRLKKPNFALIDVSGPPAEIIASDGKDLYTLLKGANEYIKSAVAPKGENIRFSFALPISMFFQPKLQGFLPFEVKPTYGGSEKIEGVEYQILEIKTEQPIVTTLRYYVNPQKLITRMNAELHQNGSTLKTAVILINVKTDIPMTDASFAFQLPKGAIPREGDPEQKLLAVGTRAPEFNIENPNGGRIALKTALKGKKAILVNFWFCSCTPCREEFPHLQKLYEELKDKGFSLIAINSVDSKTSINKYISDKKYTFPIGMNKVSDDVQNSIIREYCIMSYPTNYLIGADGTILYRCIGFDEAGLRAALEKAGLK